MKFTTGWGGLITVTDWGIALIIPILMRNFPGRIQNMLRNHCSSIQMVLQIPV